MDKDLRFFIAAFVSLFAAFFLYFGYRDYLRADYLSRATDPVAAACAFDSSERFVPPACMTYFYQKELPR